jgi:hypothetical protein
VTGKKDNTGVEISSGLRLLNFQKNSLGSNVDIPPGSLFLFTAKKSRNYAVLRLKNADMGRKVQETNAYDDGLVQNLTKKALETNQIASCK